jgi:hypothetical protein
MILKEEALAILDKWAEESSGVVCFLTAPSDDETHPGTYLLSRLTGNITSVYHDPARFMIASDEVDGNVHLFGVESCMFKLDSAAGLMKELRKAVPEPEGAKSVLYISFPNRLVAALLNADDAANNPELSRLWVM